MKRIQRIYSVLLPVLFFGLIICVLLNDIIHYYTAPEISIFENRYLARKPFWTISVADLYPKAYENFYNDHFPYRTQLIEFNAGFINYKILGKSPFPNKVNLGRDNWLFYEPERPLYQGKLMINHEQVNQVVFELHKRAEFFREKGIKFYLICPPPKQDIYPEFLPSNYHRCPTGTVTDKIIAGIKQDTLIPFIELNEPLKAAKTRKGPLYYKTDTHWNSWGAYIGYWEIINRMYSDFPRLKPLTESDFKMSYPLIKGKNLVTVIDLTDYISDNNVVISFKNSHPKSQKIYNYPKHPNSSYPFAFTKFDGDTSLPKLMVIHDSFLYDMMPFLDESFTEVTYINDTRYYGTNDNIVKDIKPDIVLMIIYQPHLVNLIGLEN